MRVDKIVKSLYYNVMKFVINTTKCDLCLFLHKMCLRWSENSVRLENLMGIGFQMGQILLDFISQCEIWHVCMDAQADLHICCSHMA